MSFKEFVEMIRKDRLSGKWYSFSGNVDGKFVTLKGYRTWLQIYKVMGIDYSNCMEGPVSQFNKDLEKPFI